MSGCQLADKVFAKRKNEFCAVLYREKIRGIFQVIRALTQSLFRGEKERENIYADTSLQ